MLRAVLQDREGRTIVLLGLTNDNLDRLKTDMPVVVKLAHLDEGHSRYFQGTSVELPDIDIVIFAGESEEAMLDQFRKRGMVP